MKLRERNSKAVSTALGIIFRFGPKFRIGGNFGRFVLNYLDQYLWMDKWSAQPFNGQAERYRQIILVAEFLKPTVAIETGTYLGTSTPALASLVTGQTFTIEFSEKLANKSRARFESRFSNLNINLIKGDSASSIALILKTLNPKDESILAYLDAHWEKDIPTKRELLELVNWGGSWVAVIDDFQVPGDATYGFDKYGDLVVDQSLIPWSHGVHVLVPQKSANTETGARKGTAYVFSASFSGKDLSTYFPGLRNITQNRFVAPLENS